MVCAADSEAPLTAAAVTIQELARTAQIDSSGRYRFSSIAGGNYTLRASAAGFQPTDTPVEVPGSEAGTYDIVLTPI